MIMKKKSLIIGAGIGLAFGLFNYFSAHAQTPPLHLQGARRLPFTTPAEAMFRRAQSVTPLLIAMSAEHRHDDRQYDFGETLGLIRYGLPRYTGEILKVQSAPFNAYSIQTLGGNCTTWGAIVIQGTGAASKCLAPVNGSFLKSNGAGVDPSWAVAAGSGTVTSVQVAVPADETASGGPITTAGTITIARNSQSAGLVLASPIGSAGIPTYRNVAGSDITAGSISPSKLFNPNAATFYGNPTNAPTATIAFTIGSLVADTTPNVTSDLMVIYNAASNQLESVTPSQLATTIGAGVPSVFGRTGAVAAQTGDYTPAQVGALPATATTQSLVTLTASPSAGKVGELISIAQTTPAAVGATNTPANIFNLTLTAGNWDCDANAGFIPNGSTSTAQIVWLSTLASATLPTSPNNGAEISNNGNTGWVYALGHLHLNGFAGGLVYFAAQFSFSAGSPEVIGAINCMRTS